MLQYLTIADPDHGTQQLAICFDRPPQPRDDGLCILYLHGFGSRQSGEKAKFFRGRALAEGLPFCSLDFRGHGDSGGELFDLTLSRNLADSDSVHRFLRDQGFERLILIGSSMGGGTALWHASRHSNDVVATLCIAPALEMDQMLLRLAGPEGSERWRETGRFELVTELVACELSWRLIEDLRTYDLATLQRAYRTPALLIQGKNDASVSWQTVLDFAVGCTFEGIELHLMADGDHRLVDRLDYLWRKMLDFLILREVITRPTQHRTQEVS